MGWIPAVRCYDRPNVYNPMWLKGPHVGTATVALAGRLCDANGLDGPRENKALGASTCACHGLHLAVSFADHIGQCAVLHLGFPFAN